MALFSISNRIKDCPVTVEDIDNDLNIWGKNIAAQKVKTNLSKPNTWQETL